MIKSCWNATFTRPKQGWSATTKLLVESSGGGESFTTVVQLSPTSSPLFQSYCASSNTTGESDLTVLVWSTICFPDLYITSAHNLILVPSWSFVVSGSHSWVDCWHSLVEKTLLSCHSNDFTRHSMTVYDCSLVSIFVGLPIWAKQHLSDWFCSGTRYWRLSGVPLQLLIYIKVDSLVL